MADLKLAVVEKWLCILRLDMQFASQESVAGVSNMELGSVGTDSASAAST